MGDERIVAVTDTSLSLFEYQCVFVVRLRPPLAADLVLASRSGGLLHELLTRDEPGCKGEVLYAATSNDFCSLATFSNSKLLSVWSLDGDRIRHLNSR